MKQTQKNKKEVNAMYNQNQLDDMMKDLATKMHYAGIPIDCSHIVPHVGQNRKESAYAACYRRRGVFTIKVSKYAMNLDEVAMRNVICHELIHTLPNCFNHGSEFKRYANIMNAKYNMSILTKGAIDSNGNHATMEIPAPKYTVTCPCCGRKYQHNKKCGVIKNPELYRCGVCGGSGLKVTQNR